jgi:hypothetical protein
MCLLGSYQREFFGGVTEDAILLGFRGFGQSGALIAREYFGANHLSPQTASLSPAKGHSSQCECGNLQLRSCLAASNVKAV